MAPVIDLLEDRTLLSPLLAAELGGENESTTASSRLPNLPGLTLVDPTTDVSGQIIFLDFDGADDVTYNGPVTVGPFDVPAFEAPGKLAGQEDTIIASVVEQLEQTFAGSGVTFTTEQPVGGVEYSAIHFGGGGQPFREYGDFFGLTERVDVGNSTFGDSAFIFPHAYTTGTSTIQAVARSTAEVATHEIAHILGAAHLRKTPEPSVLADVAFANGGPNSEGDFRDTPVHQHIAQQGYLLFRHQFGDSELDDYIGEVGLYTPDDAETTGSNPFDGLLPGNNGSFIEGAFDQDVPFENPWDEGGGPMDLYHPSTRHFWAHDEEFVRDFANGIGPYDSAPNRAIKFFTGGFGLTEDITSGNPNDDDWGSNARAWETAGRQFNTGEGIEFFYEIDRKETAYYWLGHVAHLLQDMALPAHVHADGHADRGILEDPDPLHDWIDGIEFSTDGNGADGRVNAAFDDFDPVRFETWIFDASRGGVGRIGSTVPFDTSSLRSPTEIDEIEFDQRRRDSIPENALNELGLYRLFLDTADRADNFDSNDEKGEDDDGNRGNPDEIGNRYNNWTRIELNHVADKIVPRAMGATAELIRYFYSKVDETGPAVNAIQIGSGIELASSISNPTTVQSSAFSVSTNPASDPESGVDKDGYVFIVADSAGQPVFKTAASTPDDVSVGPLPDGNYTIFASVQNGGGAWGSSERQYFRIDSSTPTVVVTASAGGNGSLSPNGNVVTSQGGNVEFLASPETGYVVDRWFVGGSPSQIGGSSLTVSNIQTTQSVFVTFKHAESGTVQLLTPNGGQAFGRGDRLHIGWESTDVSGNVRLELLSGGSVSAVISVSTQNRGSFTWEIPDDQAIGANYSIRVSALDVAAEDASDSHFEIRESVVARDLVDLDSLDDLINFSDRIGSPEFPRDGHYRLTADIDARDSEDLFGGDGFKPIGTSSANFFRGTLDGQGHKITNLWIDRQSEELVGLFSVIAEKAVVKNLTIEGGMIRAKGTVGALAGENYGLVVNVHASAEVRGPRENGADKIGGLVGENYTTGILRNCSTYLLNDDSAVSGWAPSEEVGGIAGTNSGLIEWCSSTIRRVRGRDSDIGGIAGTNYGSIRESFTHIPSDVDGDVRSGGIAGTNASNGTISDVYVLGAVQGDHDNLVGGIVGENSGTILRAYHAAGGRGGRGGVAGKNYGTISDSTWDIAFGVPSNRPAVDGGGSVSRSAGNESAGMRQEATFTALGWDFSNVWTIDEGSGTSTLRGIGGQTATPANVNASTNQTNGIHVTWSEVPGLYYQVYRAQKGDVATDARQLLSQEWNATSPFVDESAAPATRYHYWVKSAATVTGARESEFSRDAFGWREFPPISPPTGVNASDDINNVLITWNAVETANFYRVYRSATVDGQKSPISDWLNGPREFVDETALNDRVYYYWVNAAANDSGDREGAYGESANGIRDSSAPTITISSTPEVPRFGDTVSVQVSTSDENILDRVVLHWANEVDSSMTWNSVGGREFSESHTVGEFAPGGVISFWAEVTDIAGRRSESSVVSIVDEVAPNLSVNVVASSFNNSSRDSEVTFTFSEPVAGFTIGDVNATGGTVSSLTGSGSDYRATFTAQAGTTVIGRVQVDAGSYADLSGNQGTAGSDTVTIDTLAPALTVDIARAQLSRAERRSSVAFRFDEPVNGFTADDITVLGGSLTEFSGSGADYSAVFTADDDSHVDGLVRVSDEYTDAAGNAGQTGSDTVTIDTKNPSLVSVSRFDPQTSSTDADSLVFRVTFSEAVSDVTAAAFVVDGATTAAVTRAIAANPTTYEVTVSGGDLSQFNGHVGLRFHETPGVTDIVGNALSGSPETTEGYDVRNAAPAISLNKSSLEVDETGSTASFNVALTARPADDVVLVIESSDDGEAAVTPTRLTFTSESWDDPQTVVVSGRSDAEIADGDVAVAITVSVDISNSDDSYENVSAETVDVVNRSHVFSRQFVLNSTGRVTDFVDVVSLTGNENLDAELRNPDGQLLSPEGQVRVSLAGYPAGTYNIWVNDSADNVRFDQSEGFGEATVPSPIRAIDLDGSGDYHFANDGIILLAHALGSRGEQLAPFREQQAPRDGNEIETVISQLADSLDLDGDGEFRFANDGIILLAHALGSRGDQLNAFQGANATRTGQQIEERLAGLLTSGQARQQSPDFKDSSAAVEDVVFDEVAFSWNMADELNLLRSTDPIDVPISVKQRESMGRFHTVLGTVPGSLTTELRDNGERTAIPREELDQLFSKRDELSQLLIDELNGVSS